MENQKITEFVKNQSQKCKQIEAVKNLDPESDFSSDPEKIPLEKCCSQLHGNLERMEFDPSYCQNSDFEGVHANGVHANGVLASLRPHLLPQIKRRVQGRIQKILKTISLAAFFLSFKRQTGPQALFF